MKVTLYTSKSICSVNCFDDIEYVGLLGCDLNTIPICAESCTGYVIILSGLPLLSVSNLETTVALFTMEAGFFALSTSCHDLISPCQITEEVNPVLSVKKPSAISMY